MELLKERLKQLRRETRETQEELAKIIDVKRSTYGAYESGIIVPPIDKLKQIASHFGVSTDWLMGLESIHAEKDVGKELKTILSDLESGNPNLLWNGEKLTDECREILILSLKTAIKSAIMIHCERL